VHYDFPSVVFVLLKFAHHGQLLVCTPSLARQVEGLNFDLAVRHVKILIELWFRHRNDPLVSVHFLERRFLILNAVKFILDESTVHRSIDSMSAVLDHERAWPCNAEALISADIGHLASRAGYI
jgi:hypothetical protein